MDLNALLINWSFWIEPRPTEPQRGTSMLLLFNQLEPISTATRTSWTHEPRTDLELDSRNPKDKPTFVFRCLGRFWSVLARLWWNSEQPMDCCGWFGCWLLFSGTFESFSNEKFGRRWECIPADWPDLELSLSRTQQWRFLPLSFSVYLSNSLFRSISISLSAFHLIPALSVCGCMNSPLFLWRRWVSSLLLCYTYYVNGCVYVNSVPVSVC